MRSLMLVLVLGSLAACGQNSSSAADGGAEASPDAGWTPLPAHTACAAPQVQPGDTWTLASGSWSIALSWSGTEAALAYFEAGSGATVKARLQRLSRDGHKLGDPIDLGDSTSMAGKPIALASDRAHHLACWRDPNDAIACASVPVGGGPVSAGDTFNGQSPSLAYGPGGFALVFSDAGVQAVLLGSDARARGTPVEVDAADTRTGTIAATASGYRVAIGLGNSISLHLLGPDLQPTSSPATRAQLSSAYEVAVAAHGDDAALVFSNNGKVSSAVFSGSSISAPTVLDASSSTYGKVAVAAGSDGFAATWSAFNGYLGYRAFDAAGAPKGELVQLGGTSWDDNPNEIVAVDDGFLAAAALTPSGNQIALWHLGCP